MEIDTSSPPRGTKRKVDDIEPPRRIRALDQDVVNKIAAGEIIVAPVHALKELIENAVDAGSTSLEILVKDGGLKLLQITDNGCGIHKDDLPILCERFTTSKLKSFEDLQAIGTYGFRGEALASISHIAHLAVTTKTADSSCAWKAHYSGGKLVPAKPGQSADPKPCAGRQGTQITVEDLFFNVPTRRRAFRSPSEEYAKIADIVGRYAVHCLGVAFSCKKHGEAGAGVAVPATASARDRIRMTHGGGVANDLLEVKVENAQYGFRAEGFVSNANYESKRTALLLFINHRSVESTAVKRAIEQTYSAFLPKGGKPFVYLSLDIEPARVDVNVHPTKREVNFLNEDEIIELICDQVRVKLGSVDTSRTFMTQSLLSGGKTPSIAKTISIPEESTSVPSLSRQPSLAQTPTATRRPYENNLVRTDARTRKITSMLPSAAQRPSSPSREATVDGMDYEYIEDREPVLCRLTTIKELRATVRENVHAELTETFAHHTFVGVVDARKRIVAMQGGVKLFLVDYGLVAAEYFYQLGLTDFGNFGSIRLDPPMSLRELLDLGVRQARQQAEQEQSTQDSALSTPDWDSLPETIAAQLLSRREMLREYFSLELTPGSDDADPEGSTGNLLALPLLIKGYLPPMSKLPRFLLRLGTHVTWTDEKACFHTFLRELAAFYVPETLPNVSATAAATEGKEEKEEEEEEGQEEPAALKERREHVYRALENVLFPAFKARLVATKTLLKGVVEVANLRGLYRVFERC